MTKTVLTFTGRVPSKKNGTRRVKRGNRVFTMPSASYCEWEEEHVSQLQQAAIGRLQPPYSIIYRVYPPDKRTADLTNKIEGINDSLVKAGILADDNWFLLKEVSAVFIEVDRLNPRIEVEITSAEN